MDGSAKDFKRVWKELLLNRIKLVKEKYEEFVSKVLLGVLDAHLTSFEPYAIINKEAS